MWANFKMWLTGVTPELLRFIKAALKMGIDILLPIALRAVTQAEQRGGTGSEKFNFAYEYVKSQVPTAAVGAISTAIQNAWATKQVEGWN